MKTQIIMRRRGAVSSLNVELDASQAETFTVIQKKLGLSKRDAVAAAINVWISMVEASSKKEAPDGMD